ncbi:MAG: GNAT family N-acetyltransferase [Myxococcaceae bacterium]|nr:MAG: GNAT family N-acetyltransferase [Myxococcaceae bacterium]
MRVLAPQIRTASSGDAPGIAHVQVLTWQQTYRGILPDAFLDGLDVERSAESWRAVISDRRRITHVVDGPGIIGFCTAGPSRGDPIGFRGEVEAIYVHPAEQGRGHGTALVRAAMGWLAAKRLSPVLVWALEANTRAHGFYRALGAHRLDTRLLRIADALYPEVGFGWPDGSPTGG